MPPLLDEFTYEPLVGSEIRLISIEPVISGPHLQCKLYHAELNEELEYIALSYVWGESSQLFPIRLNDQEFSVTRNLSDFLHQLLELTNDGFLNNSPRSGQPRKFWVDAICIDQSSVVEKNKQVSRMGDIYSSAFGVVGFLGLPSDIDERSLDIFISHAEELSDAGAEYLSNQSYNPYPLVQILGDDLESFLMAFSKIIQRPWFERIWILQEFALSRKSSLCLIGKHRILADALGKVWFNIKHNNNVIHPRCSELLRVTNHDGPARLLFVREMYRTSSPPKIQSRQDELELFAERLLNLLIIASFGTPCKSSLPHDMIYGLLGMANPPPQLPEDLNPAYNSSYSDVCHAYSMFLMRYSRDLRLLNSVATASFTTCPSWVPDFRNLMYEREVPSTVAELSFSRDQKMMTITGVEYGFCVSTVSPPPASLELDDSGYVRLFRDFDEHVLRKACSITKADIPVALMNWLDSVSQSFMDGPTYLKVRGLVRQAYEFWIDRENFTTTFLSEAEREMANVELFYSIVNGLSSHMCSYANAVTEAGTIVTARSVNSPLMTNDVLCIPKGSSYPLILRPRGDAYQIVTAVDTNSDELIDGISERFFFSRILKQFTII